MLKEQAIEGKEQDRKAGSNEKKKKPNNKPLPGKNGGISNRRRCGDEVENILFKGRKAEGERKGNLSQPF